MYKTGFSNEKPMKITTKIKQGMETRPDGTGRSGSMRSWTK
jgi:hypothetical protein